MFVLIQFLAVQWTTEEDSAIRDPIVKKFEAEGSPFYSSARYRFHHIHSTTVSKLAQ